MLPLKKIEKIVFIGYYAKKPRYQDGGSSHIHSSKVVSILDAADGNENISFVQGFDDRSEEIDEGLFAAAVNAAKEADKAVLIVGLPERYESDGFDRKHMQLPAVQNSLSTLSMKYRKMLWSSCIMVPRRKCHGLIKCRQS